MISRRRFLSATAGSVALGTSLLLPAWARSGPANDMSSLKTLSGTTFDLLIERKSVVIDGRRGNAITLNGQLPAPLLRWREGDDITLRVTNRLDEDTSIHWHGILLPFQMDGVPGIAFPGIKPGQTFTYRFPVRQAGTYWYHSHSGLQEQLGHYGPLIIEPKDQDPVDFDREYVIVLSDFTFENPHRVFTKLMKMSDAYNFQQRTARDFFKGTREKGLGATLRDRMMWGNMRMSPTDIADVTGAAYTGLINGHGPDDNWTALFEPGQRVRLRIINASAMTIYNFRIPGLPMTVVQADGQNVRPVEADEFQIGAAETYDVVVQPQTDEAYTLMAESIDRSFYARATLAPRPGMEAAIPPLRPRPLLTMKDMGMAHGGMDHGAETASLAGQGETDHYSMDHGQMGHSEMAPDGSDHAAMGHGDMSQGGRARTGQGAMQAHHHKKGPGVANLAGMPTDRLNDPGIGLENLSHRTLAYTDLKSLAPNPDRRHPGREIEIHLTGNMERFMWSFDGVRFAEVVDPIVFRKDERVRLTMVNDTMMTHPIHLHGMFFDVVTGADRHKPRKHTINVKPGERLSVDITADAFGDWAFHCHLLYHMAAGMMRVVSVREQIAGAE